MLFDAGNTKCIRIGTNANNELIIVQGEWTPFVCAEQVSFIKPYTIHSYDLSCTTKYLEANRLNLLSSRFDVQCTTWFSISIHHMIKLPHYLALVQMLLASSHTYFITPRLVVVDVVRISTHRFRGAPGVGKRVTSCVQRRFLHLV